MLLPDLLDRFTTHLKEALQKALSFCVTNGRELVEPGDLIVGLLLEKGSIAVAGISLTVNAVDDHSLQVSLIPHTQGATTLARLAVGSRVNLEVDVLGKYVEKLLKSATTPGKEPGGITLDKLKENGFA